ncbi:HNH endonuclease [Paenibacillus medicaginis]|uniref:HNH endonuclease n=1 Tax=Paenibacillus medicaginis TaxID=1470560 RepID=A0ABV5C860_9BACL
MRTPFHLYLSRTNKPPAGYIWHHHQDGKTMILVEDKVHGDNRQKASSTFVPIYQ